MYRKKRLIGLLLAFTTGLVLLIVGGTATRAGIDLGDIGPAAPPSPVTVASAPLPTNVYVISIGVNQYPKIHTLLYAVADAQAVAEAMRSRWLGRANKVDVQLLTDQEVTPEAVTAAINHVTSSAASGDLFMFFFAGLSTVSERQYYLCMPETDDFHPSTTSGISATLLKTLLDKVQSQDRLIVLDSCGAHDGSDKMKTFLDRATPATSEARDLSDTNAVLLTSEGTAYEYPTLGHGVLTYALLQGLGGEAAIIHGKTEISAREIEAYLPLQVMSMTNGNQVFRSYSWGNDFALVPAPESGPPGHPTRQIEMENAPPPAPPPPAPTKGTDYAVIFAVNHYDDFQSLTNPVGDAEALAAELKNDYGFQVKLVRNPGVDDIKRVLLSYRQRSYAPGDQLFVFFAGHGMKGDQDSYILPGDARRQDPFFDSYIQDSWLRNALLTFPCPHILLALDVCYGGDFAGPPGQSAAVPVPAGPFLSPQLAALYPASSRYAQPGLILADDLLTPTSPYTPVPVPEAVVRLMSDRTREFLSSGGDVPVPDGDPGGHSPFLSGLLTALRADRSKPFVTAHDLLESLDTQTQPVLDVFDNTHPKGEFVFVPAKGGTP